MKVLDELPTPTRQRTEKYPWSEWFDGIPRLLEEGVDYLGKTEGFRSGAYAAARRHGVKILVRTLPEGIAIQSL